MQKKSIGFGFRGWIVLIYQFLAFVMYVSLNNFGQNVMANVNANVRGWNATLVPTVYTIVCVVSVIIQFIFGKRIANSGKVKNLSMILLTMISLFSLTAPMRKLVPPISKPMIVRFKRSLLSSLKPASDRFRLRQFVRSNTNGYISYTISSYDTRHF